MPPTPEKRAFAAVDDLLYEAGYESDGQHALWKGSGGMDEEEEGAKVSVVSDTAEVALTLPLGQEDTRFPPTPEKRAFAAVDDLLYEAGYDLDGQRAP